MRLVYVINGLGYGGGERLLADSAPSLSASSSVEVFSLKDGGPLASELRRGGIPVRSLSRRGIPRPASCLAFLRAVRAADVVHSHFFHADLLTSLLRRLGAVRGAALSTRHETGFAMRRYQRWLEVSTYRSFDVVLCVSGAVATAMRARGVDARLEVLYPSPRPAEGATSRRRAGIVCVARLDRVKGVDVLLEALGQLSAAGRTLPRVTVVGDGPERPRLERLARRLGLGSVVSFSGAVGYDGVVEALSRSSIFCLPSRQEALSVALLEAMALGLAPVVSETAGPREVVRDARAAVFVQPDSPAALAEALAGLLDSPRRTAAIGRHARRWVLEHHPPGAYSRELDRVYRSLVRT